MATVSMIHSEPVPDGARHAAEFFSEHGWYLAPAVLNSQAINDARRAVEEHWAGHRDHPLEGARKGFVDWMPGDGEGTRNNEYFSLQNERVRSLAWSKDIGRIACEAAGIDSVRLFDDQMVVKPGMQTVAAVGWHVDGDYWGTCSSPNMLTAWIPLHDCPAEMGPLVVLDGSHRWSHLIDRSALSFHQRDMSALERYLTAQGYPFHPVTLDMKRGQFSLHHGRTIHGSFPNRGANPRMALAVHMQDGANRYRPSFGPDGRPIHLYNDSICRKTVDGLPDYTDESVFPCLWSRVS